MIPIIKRETGEDECSDWIPEWDSFNWPETSWERNGIEAILLVLKERQGCN